MPRHSLAIVSCRVSSTEQLENNSLNRQRESVLKAADDLGVEIPEDGWWSGSVSSKRGTNINRKDLSAMLEYCKKNKHVKYLIVDEVDRFMRSMLEIGHFFVEFRKLGVEVVFASQRNLKTDTASDTLMLMLEAFKAEGSNEERQRKTIAGHLKALSEGRYPFPVKPGYKRGYERAVHEIDPTKGPALKRVLLRIVDRLVTPTEGLIELNKSKFITKGRSLYKMDKFRRIATDPYYAGVVEMNKQVAYRNENGRHQPLITMEQHLALVEIFSNKKKNQAGPRKNGNPEYPMNNIVDHVLCSDRRYGRVVGVDIHNGKNKQKIYKKYRCRACKVSVTREDMHEQVKRQFKNNPISNEGIEELTKALRVVWRKKERQVEQDQVYIKRQIAQLKDTINTRALAAIDPSNTEIKDVLMESVGSDKARLGELETQLESLASRSYKEEEKFLRFALGFAKNMGESFLNPSLSEVNRKRCKQIIFPEGFKLDADKNVYTPKVSPLIRLATTKKDSPEPEKSSMVRVQGL